MRTTGDPRTLALAIARGTLADNLSAGTVMLPSREASTPIAFLVSLRFLPVRVVVPLAPGINVIARSEALTQHRLPESFALPRDSWPVRWCEAAQCHIYCAAGLAAYVADRSSNGTALLSHAEPPESLPQPTITDTPLRYQVFGPQQERLSGSWQADPGTWTPLHEGDVLVSVHSPWVFGWVHPTLRERKA